MCKCGADFASSASTRVTVQVPTFTPDEYGGREESWSDLTTVWAVVEPMMGREVYISAQVQSRVDARVLIRFHAGLQDTTVASRFRVKNGNRLLNIVGVQNLSSDLKTEGREFQRILCVEGEPS